MLSGKVVKFNDKDQYKGKFLKEELTKVIGIRGRTISFKDNGSKADTTPAVIKQLFLMLNNPSIKETEKEKLFLEKSQWFANKLDSFHTGVIPGGILAILYGHFDVLDEDKATKNKNKDQVLVIAKIEEETALQVKESTEDKICSIDIQLVDNLIMLHRANVMKAGVFYDE